MTEYDSVQKLYFIWNAEWSVGGAIQETKNFIKGVESCALCEIAYSGVRKKKDWKECNASIPVPIETMYKNKVNEDVRSVITSGFPAVIAETEDGYIELMDSEDIESCEGSVDDFKELLEEKLQTIS